MTTADLVKLYFYSTEALYEDQLLLGRKPMLKIGETSQEDTLIRIQQQDGTSCAQPLVRKGDFRVSFTDKEFHRWLLERGYKKTRDDADREWFFITVEDATRELKVYAAYRKSNAEVNNRSLSLTEWQIRALRWLGESLNTGKRTLVMDLAARFGKTLAMIAAFRMSSFPVMVVANYVKTVNTSFQNEVSLYFQGEIAWVDTQDTDFKQKVRTYLDEGLKVLITCSLFNSKRLDANIDFISGLGDRLIVVDEADFGAHKENQMLRVARLREGQPLILMTGTNSDRASKEYDVDGYYSVTYPDMLLIRDGAM